VLDWDKMLTETQKVWLYFGQIDIDLFNGMYSITYTSHTLLPYLRHFLPRKTGAYCER
jgi:hypothetical protein